MKLSTIVKYKNLLDSLGVKSETCDLHAEMLNIINIVEVSSIRIENSVVELNRARKQVLKAIEQFEEQIDQLKQSVQDQIDQQEPEYFRNSLDLYNTGYRKETADYIRNRRIGIDPVTAAVLRQRLKLYTSWQHPGMVIRPAHAQYVEDLVACDPMYFVDTSDQLLELTESWFTPEYQRRLRHYVIDEHSDQPTFINLPAGQFGLIYVFHFFNYRPWPILQKYLKECFDLLRPGGILAFTYNNCDIAGRVGKVEHFSGCYTPGHLIRNYVQELGYEIVFDLDDDSNTSWLELRRPGDYSSIRGGQTLAAIYQRSSITNVVDLKSNHLYNEVGTLLTIAQGLKIDISQCKIKGQYSAKKLKRSIEQSVYPDVLTEQMITKLINQRTDP